MRGGFRRHHVPTVLTPQQVKQAAKRLAEGELLKVILTDLNVCRKTLWRALNGKGDYKGILLDGPCHGRPGSRPLLKPEKVRQAAAQRAGKRLFKQIAADLNVSAETARSAAKGLGAYASRKGRKP